MNFETGMARILCLAGLASLTTAALAQHVEVDDAGNFPGTAQSVAAGTSVIIGGIASLDDEDLFRVLITDFSAFSATVSGEGSAPLADSQIFLFDLTGAGLAHNDDISTSDRMSALPIGHALYAGLTPGEYLIGISAWNNDPYYAVSPDLEKIFSDPNYDGNGNGEVVGPRAGAAGAPIIFWDGLLGGQGTGGYRIELTGVDPVPEPATLAALGLGAAALIRKRKRN